MQNSLSLFNSLTKQKEKITKENLTLYTCGPTVYDYAHIGNLRTYIFEDLLKKTLLFLGYKVKHVMNITDVDDKTIRGAIAKNLSLNDYCKKYTEAFFEDLSSLSIQPADVYPKATDHIPQMIGMIENLLEKNHAYKSVDGSIYFSIKSFKEYGKLSHFCLEDLEKGASNRVSLDEYDKENASDFVLWKAYDEKRDGKIFWESPFGKGRPGWHIECSAMCLEHLGESIDIHCGGVDNIFPHHENEIAQSECFTGKAFVGIWSHAAHLIVDGKKMSKSKKNFHTLRSLLDQGFSKEQVRYMLIHTHYRSQLNFTFPGLDSAKASIERIQDFIYRLENVQNAQKSSFEEQIYFDRFVKSLQDDLNISSALGALFDLIREGNLLLDQKNLSSLQAKKILEVLERMDQVLGFCFPEKEEAPKEIQDALEKREQARKVKDWKEADRLRDLILKAGFLIEDTPSGMKLKKQAVKKGS